MITLFHETVETSLIAGCEDVYFSSLATSEAECAQQQICYSREGLRAALASGDYAVVVSRSSDGVVNGFCMMTFDLDQARVAYINPERYRLAHPLQAGANRILYVTFLGVAPGRQHAGAASGIIDECLRFGNSFRDPPVAFAFDYSRRKNGGLPLLIEYRAEVLGLSVNREDLDQQVFTSYTFS